MYGFTIFCFEIKTIKNSCVFVQLYDMWTVLTYENEPTSLNTHATCTTQIITFKKQSICLRRNPEQKSHIFVLTCPEM